MGSEKTFARDATGLVRDVSLVDAFFFNFWTTSGPLLTLLFLPFLGVWFPQANLVLSVLISAVFATVLGALYAFVTATMPRSGTDYVFVSRTVGPAIGLAFSLNLVWWFSAGSAGSIGSIINVINQSLASIGLMTGNLGPFSSWSSISANSDNILALGFAIYVIVALAIILGLRTYMKYVQRLVTGVSIIAFLIIIGVMAIASNQSYITNFNKFVTGSGGSDPYHAIITAATSAGFTAPSGFSWSQTLAAAVFFAFIVIWPMASAWFGGEVKRPNSISAQFLMMSGGTWVTMAIAALFMYFWQADFGATWTAAVGYLELNGGVPAWLAGSGPFAWVNILVGNPILASIVSIAFFLQAYVLAVPTILGASRHVFAWSIDRVVPMRLSDVSTRLKSPVLNIALISLIAMAGFAITTLVVTLSSFLTLLTLGAMISYCILAISAIIFRYRRKDIYDAGPLSHVKIGPISIYLLVAVASVVVTLTAIGYVLGPLNGPVLGGLANSGLEATIGLLASGFVLYYVAKAVQSRRGIHIELAFKEIPPE